MHKNQRSEINNTQQFDYANKKSISSDNHNHIHNLNKHSFCKPIDQVQVQVQVPMFFPQQQVPAQPNMSNLYQYQYHHQPLQHNSQFNNIPYHNVLQQRGYSLPASQQGHLGFNLHSNVHHSLPNTVGLGPYNCPSSIANPNLDFMPPPAAIPPFQYSTALRVYSPRPQSAIETSPSLYQYTGQNQIQFPSLNTQPMNMDHLHSQNIQQQPPPEMKPLSPSGSIKNQLSVQSLINSSNSSLLVGAPYQMPNHEMYPKSSTAWLPKDDALLRFLKEYRKLGWREISMYFPTRTLNACQFRWRRLIAGVITNKKIKNKDKDKDKDKVKVKDKDTDKDKNHQKELQKGQQKIQQKEHQKEETKLTCKDSIKVENKPGSNQLNVRSKRNIEDDRENNDDIKANGDNFKKIKIEK